MDNNSLATELVKLAKAISGTQKRKADTHNIFSTLKGINAEASVLFEIGHSYLSASPEDLMGLSPKDIRRVKVLAREIMSRASLIQNTVNDTKWLADQVNEYVPL